MAMANHPIYTMFLENMLNKRWSCRSLVSGKCKLLVARSSRQTRAPEGLLVMDEVAMLPNDRYVNYEYIEVSVKA
ncbi:hypothetical protein L915_08449 [Phytophthora nicotianae]|uniref:Uncharacterized protein n=1 Tax=Phytophthora nicotianae TaxID=4792 RepID=W2J241_PHYNI|nr:hypothetical protein L915_08449 [Phytophthora nicotianae]ETL40441.1 hypothetical protein L916_08377 [Phytophthora nicotianae]